MFAISLFQHNYWCVIIILLQHFDCDISITLLHCNSVMIMLFSQCNDHYILVTLLQHNDCYNIVAHLTLSYIVSHFLTEKTMCVYVSVGVRWCWRRVWNVGVLCMTGNHVSAPVKPLCSRMDRTDGAAGVSQKTWPTFGRNVLSFSPHVTLTDFTFQHVLGGAKGQPGCCYGVYVCRNDECVTGCGDVCMCSIKNTFPTLLWSLRGTQPSGQTEHY